MATYSKISESERSSISTPRNNKNVESSRSDLRGERRIRKMFVIFALLLLIPIIELPFIHKYYLQGSWGSNNKDEAAMNNPEEEERKALNVLVLYADDWRYDSLGSLGSMVKTPVLDKLADEGMLFTHNCVTTAVCWISRATLHTGQYMSRHQSEFVHQPSFHHDWSNTYPGQLRNQGYHLAHVGKWHFHDFPSYNYDYSEEYMGWHIDPVSNIHVTRKNQQHALHYLQTRPKDKPFCLTVAFFAPHAVDQDKRQFIPQDETMTMYVNDTVPVPLSATEESFTKLPYFFDENNEGRVRWHWRFDDPTKYQTMMKNYFRLISEIDTASGNIIQELTDQGLLNDTLIIFTTDNGYFHGEHGLADKWYPHQESIRVPLIIRDPRMLQQHIGKRNNDFTLNIDLAPTIISAAGIKPPAQMQGTDLSKLYTYTTSKKKNNPIQWRQDFFYEHPTVDNNPETFISSSQALVTKQYKYIVWTGFNENKGGFEQLFDLIIDPMELNDVVNYTTYASILGNMRDRFSFLREKAK